MVGVEKGRLLCVYPRRLFRYVLLVSVLLNLGDAPYVDEILDHFVPEQNNSDLVLTSSDGNSELPNSGPSRTAVFFGYQLLLSGVALVAANGRTPSVSRSKQTSAPENRVSFTSLPPGRIDRPPRGDSDSA